MTERPRPFGPYVLLKQLATGGRGDVYLARPASEASPVPSPVVIKRLHAALDAKGEFARRFRHEAQLAVAVDSPHVAKVFDVGRVGETYYIAFEYLAGWPLARVIQEVSAAGHRPTLQSIADIVSGALLGLHALHAAAHPKSGEALGIVHRDIAPKNIMVCEDGATRLIDLGLGKSNLQDWKTGTGVVMGSPGYMAPEQVSAGTVDARSDLYAMGIVLWEMLTLERFIKRGPVPLMLRAQLAPKLVPPSTFRGDVPPALDAVALRALAAKPEDRFEGAAEFRTALRAAVGLDDEDDGPPALNTLVGDLLWGELNRAKTEVTDLLELVPSQPAIAGEPIEILAQRAPSSPPPAPTRITSGMAPPHVEYAAMPAAGTPTPMPYAVPLGSGPLPAPRTGVPLRMVLGLMLLTLAIGIGVGAVMLRRPEVQPVPLAPAPVADTPAPSPSAAPSIRAEPAPAPERAATPPAPERKRRARRSPRSSPKTTRDEPAAPPPATEADALSLLRRVMAVRGRLPEGSPHTKTAGRLVTDLQAEVSSANPASTRLAKLEREVRRLERAARARP